MRFKEVAERQRRKIAHMKTNQEELFGPDEPLDEVE
jgi:hypothetical protein